jgi:hypothetical protein|tara:strand:- start:2144 stop:2269 length:126 start_codon:yes stop_codon:yes gene_type:complete
MHLYSTKVSGKHCGFKPKVRKDPKMTYFSDAGPKKKVKKNA